jgi:hypothetical protein
VSFVVKQPYHKNHKDHKFYTKAFRNSGIDILQLAFLGSISSSGQEIPLANENAFHFSENVLESSTRYLKTESDNPRLAARGARRGRAPLRAGPERSRTPARRFGKIWRQT